MADEAVLDLFEYGEMFGDLEIYPKYPDTSKA